VGAKIQVLAAEAFTLTREELDLVSVPATIPESTQLAGMLALLRRWWLPRTTGLMTWSSYSPSSSCHRSGSRQIAHQPRVEQKINQPHG
jgi:hypothetical protein